MEKTQSILRVIERLREVDAEMQIQSAAVLLRVAANEVPMKMKDIASDLGISQASVSRNIGYLGGVNRHHEKGHNLVEAYEDPNERRRKLCKLTPKGKRFIKGMEDLIYQ